MFSLRHFGLVFICAVALVTVSACGGGSSSSGVGKSAAGALTGRYTGFGEATFTAPGAAPLVFPFVIVIVINPDNTVVLDPETPIPGTGTITGNIITAAYPANMADSPGVSCTGIIGVSGIVTGGTITGNIGPSTYQCNGIPISVQGPFRASKVATTPAPGIAPTPAPGANYRSQGNTLDTVIRDTLQLAAPRD